MRTRTVHHLDSSTINALIERRKEGHTLRELATELGLPESAIATLSDVLRNKPGALTPAGENDLRRRLHLPPLPEPRLFKLCPTCGGDHDMTAIPDCHGKPVAAIVCLAPNETVTIVKTTPRRKRSPCFRPYLSLDPGKRITQLRKLLADAERQYKEVCAKITTESE